MQPRVDTTGGLTGAIVYWLLVCMGVSSLAMCVLWPEWREYQAIRTAEQVQRICPVFVVDRHAYHPF